MNENSTLNVSGKWDGTFDYPANAGPVTPFLVILDDTGGNVVGTVIEPDAVYRTGDTLEADLTGQRSGRDLSFVKTYASQRRGYEHPIHYDGQLSEDGRVVTGSWTVLGWTGTFEMVREESVSLQKSIERSEKTPEPLDN